MNLINNKNIIIDSDDTLIGKMNLSFNLNQINNLVGGDYTCYPNKNKFDQICAVESNDKTNDKTNDKSNKNIFKTKTECENVCENKFINVQLKKSNLFKECVQFYLFIKDLINKEHMKIYIKGGNVIGLAVLKLIYDEYKNNDIKFAQAFKNFLSMEFIKDWDFTAYTNDVKNKIIMPNHIGT